MNLSFADVKQYSSSLRLLYVEDEEVIRTQFCGVFNSLFKEVITAEDGADGLEKFHKFTPDIIISDIRMPNMDGLAMAQEIRKSDLQVPIILATAHNDEGFFMRAIEIGIDRYILKPVDKNKLIAALINCTKSVCDRISAERLAKLELQDKINQQCAGIVGQLIDAVPNPIVTLQDNRINFVNQAFCQMTSAEFLKKLESKDVELDDIFEKDEGYMFSLSELNPKGNNKVAVKTRNGRKIYQVSKAEILLPEGESDIVYVFSDITKIEYQKMKLKQYSEHLEEFFYKKMRKEQEKAAHHADNSTSASTFEPQTRFETNVTTLDEKIRQKFGEEELSALRRSRKGEKITAREFMRDIGADLVDVLEDLMDLEREVEEHVEILSMPLGQNQLKEIGVKLAKYSATIGQMFDFEDLSLAVRTLAEFLLELAPEDVTDKQFRQLKNYLDNIRMDLKSWRITNFVGQSSEDIHYLDASLMSSCLQLQMAFMPSKPEDEEEDLGLDLF